MCTLVYYTLKLLRFSFILYICMVVYEKNKQEVVASFNEFAASIMSSEPITTLISLWDSVRDFFITYGSAFKWTLIVAGVIAAVVLVYKGIRFLYEGIMYGF